MAFPIKVHNRFFYVVSLLCFNYIRFRMHSLFVIGGLTHEMCRKTEEATNNNTMIFIIFFLMIKTIGHRSGLIFQWFFLTFQFNSSYISSHFFQSP